MKQFVVAVLLFAVLATTLAITSADREEIVEGAQSKYGLPNPFNFKSFKQAYHKNYDSQVEESSRMKMFLARCYQVFVSAVSYFHGKDKYYLKINERADWTRQELEAANNKFTISAMLQASGQLQVDDHSANDKKEPEKEFEEVDEEDPLVEPEELADELEEIRVKSDREPELKLLTKELEKLNPTGLKRRKRSSGEHRPNFSIQQAFDMKMPGYESSRQMPRPGRVDYTQMDGYKEQRRRVIKRDEKEGKSYKKLPVKGNHKTRGIVSKITKMFQGQLKLPSKAKKEHETDIVWIDFRTSGCISPIQNQGICGSCYAFASMTWLEWLHCSKTGELIKLSEQYLVDCGLQNQPGMNGCDGSNFYRTAEFITNFGLELKEHYPSTILPNKCPYEPGREIKEMGYYRADASDVLIVDMKFAEDYLKKWPIMVEIHATGDFQWYGGGVWDGKGCKHKSDHCVLIVGHGREDDEEYWLIRNSYGLGWGEQGYMKLNKNSNCIFLPQGYIFGTVDGKENIMSLERNKNIPEPVSLRRLVKKHRIP